MKNNTSMKNDTRQVLLNKIADLQQYQYDAIEFQHKLEILQSISRDLDRTQSFDELCRYGVEFGIRQLGFDRMSFWFTDDKREHLIGTFGIDENGQMRDERHERRKLDHEVIVQFSIGKSDLHVVEDTPLYNHFAEPVGTGWLIAVPLLDGDEFVGYLSCDNLLSQQPIKSYYPKLLQLYGATIGYLARNKQSLARTRLFHHAMEQSQACICFFDPFGHITYLNATMISRFHGLSLSHVQEVLDALNHQSEAESTTVTNWDTLITDLNRHYEWRIPVGDKRYQILDMSISTIAEDAEPTQYIMRLEDVTLRRDAEQQRVQLQLEHERAELLQTFVTHTAHDFKTPLSIINTKAYLLGRYAPDEKAREHTRIIEAQSKHIEYLLEDMLEMVRLQSQSTWYLQRTNISAVLSMSVANAQLMGQGNARDWQLDIVPNIIAMCDETWFSKAIRNILENAIAYSEDGSHIKVSTSLDADYAYVDITDSGIGIAEDELELIFEPLYRINDARTSRGTGLGLAITKQVVERSGGKIYATSELGVGTTIHIALPIRQSSV